ncbi:hypothetical protein B0H14DRAFT_2775059 [Mycena olivaceomarginata]|nr:hypothetical protein B0H14DRAFT_2775059 [Mycena olivaceomarginata]
MTWIRVCCPASRTEPADAHPWRPLVPSYRSPATEISQTTCRSPGLSPAHRHAFIACHTLLHLRATHHALDPFCARRPRGRGDLEGEADSWRRRLAIRLFAADIPEGLLEDKKSADYFRFGHRFPRTSLHFPRMVFAPICYASVVHDPRQRERK